MLTIHNLLNILLSNIQILLFPFQNPLINIARAPKVNQEFSVMWQINIHIIHLLQWHCLQLLRDY